VETIEGENQIEDIESIKIIEQSAIALQHKFSEDRLKQCEMHFRNIFENAQIGIYHTDKEGNIFFADLLKDSDEVSIDETDLRQIGASYV
jgi:PAS domain-containing protein